MTGYLESRRTFLRNVAALSVASGLQACRAVGEEPAQLMRPIEPIGDENAHLVIREHVVLVDSQEISATTVDGDIPGSLVRLREGEDAVLSVTNLLAEDSSIHWHGLILPPGMDGVPGVSFAGIKPGETFTYRFPVRQSGTYWYHSHSGLQEQTGVFGPLVIDPAETDPVEYDREYVIMLSDWTFENPYEILKRLKRRPGYYNYQRRTLMDLARDASEKGLANAMEDRMAWAKMRMDPTDIADITGQTYTYLMNGESPADNWTGHFEPGERIRLRFINAAAASYFDVRIPGLEMTVVQADGQNIEPVTVDEFRIAIAETFDVVVEPTTSNAFTIFAEAMDRSGYARGTLTAAPDLTAEVPQRRRRALLTMADMGMPGMSGMESAGGMDAMTSMKPAPSAGVPHEPDDHGPGNSMIPKMSSNRLHEPGIGLGDAGRRVLVYSDLRGLSENEDKREPEREMELHLTGNMERYMWSFDGVIFSEVDGPIPFQYDERLGITFVNDTMMDHPIHLHGMWMELQNGAGQDCPRKHTISIKPAEKVSVLISVDVPGDWAFHCHLFYHLAMGMFRVVSVQGGSGEVAG